MEKDETKKTARTYRIEDGLLEDLRAFRKRLSWPTSETAIVHRALREFLNREHEDGKRAARR